MHNYKYIYMCETTNDKCCAEFCFELYPLAVFVGPEKSPI